MKKILLTQTAFLGDVVLATPIIDILKKYFSDGEIHFLTTPVAAHLFSNDNRIAKVHTVEKRSLAKGGVLTRRVARCLQEYNFDTVFSLHRSARSSILHYLAKIPRRIGFSDSHLPFLYTDRVNRYVGGHAVQRNASLLSILDKEYLTPSLFSLPPLSLFAPSDSEVSELVSEAYQKESRYVLLCPGSAWKTKRWHWFQYRELVKLLVESGYVVWLSGTESEYDTCERVRGGVSEVRNLAGKISIKDFLWIVKNAQAVVCNDSFALHVSSAFQKPTVAVFCATSPTFGFGPWMNENARIVEKKGLWCKPCRPHGGESCPTKSESCSREVTAKEVYQELMDVICV